MCILHRRSGSPLRVQGKEINETIANDGYRITPACAGKSEVIGAQFASAEDHPCVCREKSISFLLKPTYLGSPLRVQGKGNPALCKENGIRITPACAGKSTARAALLSGGQDHPCVCREKADILTAFWRATGSPLRVQGKVHSLPQK